MTGSLGAILAVLFTVTIVGLEIGLRIAALGIIPGGRRPSTGMAWLLLIMIEPILGFTIFFFFGSTRLGRKRHERLLAVNGEIATRTHDLVPPPDRTYEPAYVGSVVALNHHLSSLPLTDGNHVEFIEDYRASIAAMTEAVRSARRYVKFEFYISALDDMTRPLFEAMKEAHDRGVKVRILFDHLGSRGIPGYKDNLVAFLEGSGIPWHPMLPIAPLQGKFRRPDLRNHRKLLVVDGEVGFTGSQNVTEPGYNKPKNHELGREWVELMVRLHGPVVASLEALFASDWWLESDERLTVTPQPAPASVAPGALRDVSCQIVPSGPGYVAENNLRLFTTLIYGATKRISLTSPYFVPDESLLYAVTTAAQRGVEVELFVSELSDQFMVGHAQASYYKALLEAGVVIYLYPAPYILHSKHFSIDSDVAVVGSSNMDMRSFGLNYEVSLMMLGSEVVDRIRLVEDTYRAKSRRLTLEEWEQRPGRLRYVDNVMRLTAALQ